MPGTRELAARAGVDADLAQRFMHTLIEAVVNGNEKVIIRGLGTFDRRTLPARTFKTALMAEAVHKPARDTVRFKPSKALKRKLNR